RTRQLAQSCSISSVTGGLAVCCRSCLLLSFISKNGRMKESLLVGCWKCDWCVCVCVCVWWCVCVCVYVCVCVCFLVCVCVCLFVYVQGYIVSSPQITSSAPFITSFGSQYPPGT